MHSRILPLTPNFPSPYTVVTGPGPKAKEEEIQHEEGKNLDFTFTRNEILMSGVGST